MIDQSTFYIIALVFGIFWVIVEGLIAYFIYKLYKIMEEKFSRKRK